MADDDVATEGTQEWRELTQQTNEQAEELQPPVPPDEERKS